MVRTAMRFETNILWYMNFGKVKCGELQCGGCRNKIQVGRTNKIR